MIKKNSGNAFMISIIFILLILVIFIFICVIFASEMGSIAYNIKLDMYSFNKSAIISVNKSSTSRGEFSYEKEDYKKYFVDLLKKNYDLNDDLKNNDGIVKEVKIKEYEIIKKGKKDKYIDKKVNDMTIHSVIQVRIKPFFQMDFLEKICTFDIHEDVVLNELIM